MYVRDDEVTIMKSLYKMFVSFLLLSSVVLVGSSTGWAAMLFLSPVSQTVFEGDPVLVNVRISGLGDGMDPSVGSFDLDVTYDTSVLAATGVTFGPHLGDGIESIQSFDLSSPGLIDLAEISFLFDLSGQPANFTLATLLFDTVAPGTSPLTFTQSLVSDAFGFPLALSHVGDAEVTVMNPIPAPSAMVLFGTGLAGFVIWRWTGCRRR